MSKTMLALLFATVAMAGCKKDNDQPAEKIPSIEGVFTGNLLVNGTGEAPGVLVRLRSDNTMHLTSIPEGSFRERGTWQLQGTLFKARFTNGLNDSLTMDATWNASALTLNGDLKGSDNRVVAAIKLTQKELLPIEGSYTGSRISNSTGITRQYSFTIRPDGVIEDNLGTVGAWKLNEDIITAKFPAKGSELAYTIAAFHNPASGSLQGEWRNEKEDGTFKATRQSN